MKKIFILVFISFLFSCSDSKASWNSEGCEKLKQLSNSLASYVAYKPFDSAIPDGLDFSIKSFDNGFKLAYLDGSRSKIWYGTQENDFSHDSIAETQNEFYMMGISENALTSVWETYINAVERRGSLSEINCKKINNNEKIDLLMISRSGYEIWSQKKVIEMVFEKKKGFLYVIHELTDGSNSGELIYLKKGILLNYRIKSSDIVSIKNAFKKTIVLNDL